MLLPNERIEKGSLHCFNSPISISGIEGFGSNGYLIDQKDEPVRIQPSAVRDFVSIFETLSKLIIARSVTFYFSGTDQGGGYGMDSLLLHLCRRMRGQIKRLGNMEMRSILWLHRQQDIGGSRDEEPELMFLRKSMQGAIELITFFPIY